MKNAPLFRVIDANLNRSSEGLRVLEEYFRFVKPQSDFTGELKTLRHEIRCLAYPLEDKLLEARDSLLDPGFTISQDLGDKPHLHTQSFLQANLRRVEEGLRSLSEFLRLLVREDLAKKFEVLRFKVYDLEKRILSFITAEKEKPKGLGKHDCSWGLYGISGEALTQGRGNIFCINAMLESGIKVIQYREKHKSGREKIKEAGEIKRLCDVHGADFIVNDDPFLALSLNASGVHLGQDDWPIEEVRKIMGPHRIIGLSTHNPQQALEACRRGVDYIGVGPLFATQTKEDVCAPVGLGYLDWVAENIPLPFVAIGGIKMENLGEVKARGAFNIALVSEILGAADVKRCVDELNACLRKKAEVMNAT